MHWTQTTLALLFVLWNVANGERSQRGYHRRSWKNQKEARHSLRRAQVDVAQFVLSQSKQPSTSPTDVFVELSLPVTASSEPSSATSSEPSSAPTLSTKNRVKGETNSAPSASVQATNVVSKLASKVKKAGEKTAAGAEAVAEKGEKAKKAQDKAAEKRKGVQGDSCGSTKSKAGAYGVSQYKSGSKSSKTSATARNAGGGKGGKGGVGGDDGERTSGSSGGKGGKKGGTGARGDCAANEGDESTGGADDTDGTNDGTNDDADGTNGENDDPAKADTGGGSFQIFDCEAVAAGNGETNSLSQEFEIQAEFIIEDNASIDDVANDVQIALQENVATTLVGCPRRRLQVLPAAAVAVNALFSTPVASDAGDCGPNCHPIRSKAELFFWGTAFSSFPDTIRDGILQAQIPSIVSGLESIENLIVRPVGGIKDVEPDPAGPDADDPDAEDPDAEDPDAEDPNVNEIQSEPESVSQSITTGRIVAISASTLVLLLLLICACCRYRSQRAADETLKDPSAEALETHPENNANVAGEERAWFAWFNQSKNGHERMVSDDDSTKISDFREGASSPSDFATSPDRVRSEFTLFQGPETVLQEDSENPRKVNVVDSPSNPRFLQVKEEKIEVVPHDATREYYVNDTVAL